MSVLDTHVEIGPGGSRRSLIAGVQLAVMGALSLLLITSISPVAAIKGDPLIKCLFIGRIVVLTAAATVVLRLSGRRWADVGLRKVRPARFLLAIPLGLAAAFAISSAADVAIAKLGIQRMPADDWYSALHGLLHLYQGAAGATVAGALGLALGFVWWFSGRNLWAGIVVHGIIDSLSITGLYLGLVGRHG